MAPQGAERHREAARVIHDKVVGAMGGTCARQHGEASCWGCQPIAAALARVEADTLELAARDLDDRARSWRADGGRHDAQWKTIAGHCADTCESEAKRLRHLASNARALASEPVAGEARPSGPREA